MAKIQCNVISYLLRRTVDITIILPTVTIPESKHHKEDNIHHTYPHPYPVLYLLHGIGNNHQQWCSYTNIELYAEERQIAVVMISGENKCYMNTDMDLFYDFLEEELPEFITNTFPISKKKEDTYIAGLSMGGYGALYHGLTQSPRYHAIGAFSPALDVEHPLIYDLREIPFKDIPKLYITCGEDDFIYQNDINFVQYLQQNDIDHTWVSEKGYAHEWRFWDLAVERFLDWIPRSDHYAGMKRKV